jgi:hypothetical protein
MMHGLTNFKFEKGNISTLEVFGSKFWIILIKEFIKGGGKNKLTAKEK